MKKSPQLERLETILRSSRLSARGFMGKDSRSLVEIIDADARELTRFDKTPEEVAKRMKQISEEARKGLGDWVMISEKLRAWSDDTRGVIACPWPHAFRASKTVTTVERIDTGKTLRWSELIVHLVGEHGFFQGCGSPFRMEPSELVAFIF